MNPFYCETCSGKRLGTSNSINILYLVHAMASSPNQLQPRNRPLINFWSCMYRRAQATTVQRGHTCKMQGKKHYAADLAASFLTHCRMYDAASTTPRFPMIRMLVELKNPSALLLNVEIYHYLVDLRLAPFWPWAKGNI